MVFGYLETSRLILSSAPARVCHVTMVFTWQNSDVRSERSA